MFQPEIGDFFKHAEAGEKKGVAYKKKCVYSALVFNFLTFLLILTDEIFFLNKK